jgi:prolyl-tRNA synthetase
MSGNLTSGQRMSQFFGQTLREAPSEAEVVSHQLLLRAGFIRQLAAGVFTYLPLAWRSLRKIENILREEIDAIGGQELKMPVVHPADLWQETGRWYEIGPEMARLQDRQGRDMALAMTHEEVVADLARRDIRSYKQLPQLIYHIQTKFRDDPRPRAGLVRVREFDMLDSYTLDRDEAGLDKQYRAHYQAYFNIYNRCALPTLAVGADVGMMGGKLAHEYMYLTPIGEDTLILCDACGYSANRQIAHFEKPLAPQEAPRPVEKIPTPDTKTIDTLATLLNMQKSRTAKAVFMVATIPPLSSPPLRGGDRGGAAERFVFAVIRGDMEVNETKLANAVKASELRPATEDEIRAVGAEPGYGSPLGVHDAIIVADDAVASSPNLVAGANEPGYHLLNVNLGRDYAADIVTDIAAACEGDGCPTCGKPLHASRGVEVGNIFKLGTRYTEAMGATYLDEDGQARPIVMGSYGIGLGRLLACVAEEHHDDKGLIWPVTIAPYQVSLVWLPSNSAETQTAAERIHQSLRESGIQVLFDDRRATPGVKFADADLIGLPLRITVADRSLAQGGVELKRRDRTEKTIVPEDELVAVVRAELQSLHDDIGRRVVPVMFPEN